MARIDCRTFEDSSGSDYEFDDTLEAWLEGSTDGIEFHRFPGSSIIPFLTGEGDFGSPPAGTLDALKQLELPDGASTSFSTEGNPPVPAEIRFLRLRIAATVSSSSERIYFDNLSIGLGPN